MKSRHHSIVFRVFVCVLLFAAMLLGELMLVMLVNTSLPDRISLPVLRFWPMFSNLVQDYPWQSLEMLADQALMVIRHDDANGTALWAMYYYPLKLLLYVLLASIIGIVLTRRETGGQNLASGRLIAGVSVIMLTVAYMQLASCCSGPTWVVDLGLRVLADPASPYGGFWHALYPRQPTAFMVLRIIMVLAGSWLTISAFRTRRSGMA